MRFIFTILFAMIGAVIGFLTYLRTPEIHRSTTRLLIEQSAGQILDADSKSESSPLSFEILQSQLYSDKCIQMAFGDQLMQPFRERYNDDQNAFASDVHSSLVLEREVAADEGNQLILLLHYTSDDPELVEAGVKSFSRSLQKYLDESSHGDKSDLKKLINEAMEELHPKIVELENRYRAFMRDAPLTFGPNGAVVNTHEQQLAELSAKRRQLSAELMQKEIVLAKVEAVSQTATDPVIALNVLEKMVNISLVFAPGDEPAESEDAKKAAVEAIAAITYASKAEVDLLTKQVDAIDKQTSQEKSQVGKLSKLRGQREAMIREIERNQQLMDQLESQMTAITLADDSTTKVTELTAPTRAYLVGPLPLKYVGTGVIAGLFLGLLLAITIGPGRRKQSLALDSPNR